jgi:hypothetical protein
LIVQVRRQGLGRQGQGVGPHLRGQGRGGELRPGEPALGAGLTRQQRGQAAVGLRFQE